MSKIKLGEFQELNVVKMLDFGAYLCPPDDKNERVLLPKKELPKGTKVDDTIKVFVYKDSEDRLIATTEVPLIELNEVERLRVKEVTKIGAFLEWGLPKDLLLPYHEQIYKVKEGDCVLVSLYIDKSDRLCATMHVYDYLLSKSAYIEGDEVSGRVYEISENFGVFVAVDDKYSALIPKKDVFEDYKINQPVNARVAKVLDDGRLTLSTKRKISEQMSLDAEQIHKKLQATPNNFLPYNDKSSPDDIKAEFKMSKAAFKRAIGNLYKMKLIQIKEDGIYLN
ncbi:MAG: S1 RNA-binding domain-containing protein [Lachnospiraceae bacterium]|nr:S1 RNA-binding domain-containing protein [Lachnospiraceae bacterium]